MKKNNDTQNEELVAVKVWDWQTRVLHWLNALLVISLVLLILGYEGLEEMGRDDLAERFEELHAYFGGFFAVTFTLRVIWAFMGNKYARWSDIVPYTKEKITALKENIKWFLSGFKNKAPLVVGHNPVASLLYIALFFVLLAQIVTGLLLAGIEFDMFPGNLITGGLGEHAVEEIEEVAEEIHEFGLWFVIGFFIFHMGGLLIHHLFDRGGLLASMIHGKKYFRKEDLEL